MELSPGNYRDWKRLNAVASGFGTYTTTSLNLVGAGSPAQLTVGQVSADLFDVLGVAPAIGHGFSAGDDVPDGPRATLLSYGLWQARFAGDRTGGRSHGDARRPAVHGARRDAAGLSLSVQ